MGLILDGKVVHVTNDHEELVDTSVAANPRLYKVGRFEVYALLRRKKHDTFSYDGNPLIYAIKDGFGYSIERTSAKLLIGNCYEILRKLPNLCDWDFVVPMPSSSDLTTILATRVERACKGAVKVDKSLFSKRTIGDVLLSA